MTQLRVNCKTDKMKQEKIVTRPKKKNNENDSSSSNFGKTNKT